ncbi:HAMP domain-containing protein [Candidatus Dependentiae bacterium]|nr:HAMP domain-containing protein [Candidatus Dependentiae bacterium]
MKLKNILFIMALILISCQTFLVTYFGYDKIVKNYRENEINIIKKIADNFIYNILNFEELQATTDFFVKNMELQTKIILENKNQIKFIATQFKKNAGIEKLFITNYSNKLLYKSNAEFKYQNLTSNILKNNFIQNISIDSGQLYSIYGCPVTDGKNIIGSVIALKIISPQYIRQFSTLNNIGISFILDGNEISTNIENSYNFSSSAEVFKNISDINGSNVKIIFQRDISPVEILSYKANKHFILINIAIAFILYIAGIALIHRLTRSLRNIEKASTKISQGQYDLNIKKSRITEINRVISSFNSMSSELKKTQDYIVRQEKLYLAGKLANGISHELNNPLVACLGYTQMLIEKYDNLDSETKKYLQHIESNIIRARSIVKSLLTYSKKQNVCKIELNLNSVVEECILLVKYNIKKKEILIRNNISAKFKLITDKEIFKQVLINIFLNSIDAINHDSGIIDIAAYNDNYGTIIEIKDNGQGINEETIPNVFEPFFTTKQDSDGAGLGLFLCYNYMKQLGGEIDLKNITSKSPDKNQTNPADKQTGVTVLLKFPAIS